MSEILAVTIVLVVFIGLLVIETPVAFALGASGVLGIAMLTTTKLADASVAAAPYDTLASYSLAIIPLYILLGMFVVHGRLAERIYGVGAVALRFLPGGLGIATVAACAGFAAVSGSSIATAASIGKISIGEMRRNGYNVGFAAGIVAVGGTLGILIPPSVAMVMIGIVANISIGQLLVAGIVPGILSAVAYMVFVALRARKLVVDPSTNLTAAVSDATTDRRISAKRVVPSTAGDGGAITGGAVVSTGVRSRLPKGGIRSVFWLAAIFAAVMLGVFTGLFTVIESAAIGAIVALVMLLVENAPAGVREIWRRLRSGAVEAASISAMAFTLLVGATIFSTFLVRSRVPYDLAAAVQDLAVPGIVVVIVILLILIPMGMFLESLSIIIIVVPLVYPIIISLGFDPIWFGVLFVMMLELGLVTPPVGMNLFVVSSTAKIPLHTVVRGVMPFIGVSLFLVVLVLIFPDLALWLPSLIVK